MCMYIHKWQQYKSNTEQNFNIAELYNSCIAAICEYRYIYVLYIQNKIRIYSIGIYIKFGYVIVYIRVLK